MAPPDSEFSGHQPKTKFMRGLTGTRRFSRLHLAVFILIFAFLGGYLLFKSFAAPNPNLPGDLDGDNTVSILDLSILLADYGTSDTNSDINSDDTVNILDLSILLTNYGDTYTPSPTGEGDSLYSITSPWNTSIAANATVYSGSSDMIQGLIDQANTPQGFVIGVTSYTIPIYFADASTPRHDMTITDYNPGVMYGVPIPDGARPDPGSDHHLCIIDTSTNTEYDFFNVLNGDISTYTASGGATISTTGSGIFTAGGGQVSMRGSGFALAAGVIRPEELAAGNIQHAIGLVAGNTSRPPWPPASESDGAHTGPTAIPMGARVQLDPSFSVDAQPWQPWQKTIAKAIQRYGLIVFDSDTAGLALEAQNPVSMPGGSNTYPWGTDNFPDMSWLPFSSLRVLNPPTQ